ncbi:MAG TPA: hypothetical protein VMU84_10430 [Thermoanaerobaculia bacterium]|nr:hypothetical protein [Thermoanaerobaculia bacterium]
MSEKKGWGHTVLGWFVVQDDAQSADALLTDADGAPLLSSIVDAADARSGSAFPPIPPPPPLPSSTSAQPAPKVFSKQPPPAAKGGSVDFAKVFAAADIDAQEQDRVAKSVDLLRSLPADTAPVVKKQIVEASLKAFGVPIDKIIETGVEEIQALEAYIRAGAADTQKKSDESDQRIRTLEESIKELRAEMQQCVADQQAIIKACNEKKLEVQQILEFFGQEAVAKVVHESPKLIEPGKK